MDAANQAKAGTLVGPALAVGRDPGVAPVVTETKGVTAVTTLGGDRTRASICSGETTALRSSGAELWQRDLPQLTATGSQVRVTLLSSARLHQQQLSVLTLVYSNHPGVREA
jgi:hypothetical protein